MYWISPSEVLKLPLPHIRSNGICYNANVTEKEKIQLIRSCMLFSELEEEDLMHIAAVVREKVLPAKTVFIEEGTPGEEAYIVYKGLTKVYRMTEEGKEVQIALRSSGEIIGELAILDAGPRSAHVATLQETHVLVISKKELEQVVHKRPSVALGVIRNLAKRIRENTSTMQSMSSVQLNQRMLSLLITLRGYFSNQEITMSHEELAQLIGATRPRVTEALHTLAAQKKIVMSHKKITIVT